VFFSLSLLFFPRYCPFADLAGNKFVAKLVKHFTSPTHKQETRHSSPHDTTLPLPTQPHPTYSSPHPPLAPSTPHTHPPWNSCSLLFPKYSSQRLTDTREGVCITRVWIPNLGALLIIASASLTHTPCLFACLYESMSCMYVFFFTWLSICVLRAACFMFCWIFIEIFSISKLTSIWLSLNT